MTKMVIHFIVEVINIMMNLVHNLVTGIVQSMDSTIAHKNLFG